MVLIQLAAAVDSLWVVPGFGQFAGAVMSRMGMVTIDFGSQTGKSYLGSFLVIPITVGTSTPLTITFAAAAGSSLWSPIQIQRRKWRGPRCCGIPREAYKRTM